MSRLTRLGVVAAVGTFALLACGGGSSDSSESATGASSSRQGSDKVVRDADEMARQVQERTAELQSGRGDPCKLVERADIDDVFGATITGPTKESVDCKFHLEGDTLIGPAGSVGAEVLVRYSAAVGKEGFANLRTAFKAPAVDGVGDEAFVQEIGGAVVTFRKGDKVVDVQAVFVGSTAPKDQITAATIELAKVVAHRV